MLPLHKPRKAFQGGIPDAQPVVRRPGMQASPDASIGRGGGIPATLSRLPDLPAHPRGAAARCRRASPHPITGKRCHPQTHRWIPPEGGPRRDRKEFEGPASGQINHRSDDRQPAAR